MTKKRRRPIHLHVMVSEAEQALIQERMAEAGIEPHQIMRTALKAPM